VKFEKTKLFNAGLLFFGALLVLCSLIFLINKNPDKGQNVAHIKLISGMIPDINYASRKGETVVIDGAGFCGHLDIRSEKFVRGSLSNANLDEVSIIVDTEFKQTSFRMSHLHGVNLSYSRFTNCDFTGADLQDADLSGTKFVTCNLGGTLLKGCWYNNRTVFPTGFDPVKEGLYMADKELMRKHMHQVLSSQ